MIKSNRFSKNISAVKMSPIVKISELVKDKAQSFREEHGEDFVFFQRGEIGFSTPEYISGALTRALKEGHTRYPRSGGEPVLKEAIIRKLERVNGAKGIQPENVLVTYGGQEALQLSFKLFEGGKGAGFGPCWSCVLENFVPYNDIEFQMVPLRRDFSVDWRALEAVLKTVDFFYLNSPQNPTGKVFSEAEVYKISDMCKQFGVYLISDEAYERIVYDGKSHFSASAINEPHIISCFTFSKAYAMTGWRVGYVVCRDPKVVQLGRLGDYSQTAGVVTFVQHAAAAALNEVAAEQAAISKMMEVYQWRRDLLFNQLNSIEGLEVKKPEGAFYFFPNFDSMIPKGLDKKHREKYIFELLLSHGVAVVYGSCFGQHFDSHVRISFSATDGKQIMRGVERIKTATGGKAWRASA